jgi:hypothetical protein
MSYIILRGCRCDSIVLNVHAATEDKIDDRRTASIRNYNVYSINFLNTI